MNCRSCIHLSVQGDDALCVNPRILGTWNKFRGTEVNPDLEPQWCPVKKRSLSEVDKVASALLESWNDQFNNGFKATVSREVMDNLKALQQALTRKKYGLS